VAHIAGVTIVDGKKYLSCYFGSILFLKRVSFDYFIEELMPFAVICDEAYIRFILVNVDQPKDRWVVD
jgi:hypothetical protein